MKYQRVENSYWVLSVALFLLLATIACAKNDGRTPEQVVRQYFDYCSKKNFNAAVNLTCFQRSCIYDGESSDITTTVATSAVERDGKITDSTNSSEDWIKGGSYSPKYIAEEQARTTKVLSTKTSKNIVEIITETGNYYNVKRNYVTCLRRERETKNWRIERVSLINHAETAENDPCFLKMDGFKEDQ